MNTTISIDTILTVASFIVLITLYIANSRSIGKILGVRLDTMDLRMDEMTKEMKKLAEIAAAQARMDERTLGDGRRIDELERRFNRLSEKTNDLSFSPGSSATSARCP